jgi:hypothetical protein
MVPIPTVNEIKILAFKMFYPWGETVTRKHLLCYKSHGENASLNVNYVYGSKKYPTPMTLNLCSTISIHR